MNKKRFTLKKTDKPRVWLVSDAMSGVSIEFEQHKFNESQSANLENRNYFASASADDLSKEVAQVMREIGDYLFENAYYVAMPLDDSKGFAAYHVRKAIERSGLSLDEVSERSGLKPLTIQKIANGDFCVRLRDFNAILATCGYFVNISNNFD